MAHENLGETVSLHESLMIKDMLKDRHKHWDRLTEFEQDFMEQMFERWDRWKMKLMLSDNQSRILEQINEKFYAD